MSSRADTALSIIRNGYRKRGFRGVMLDVGTTRFHRKVLSMSSRLKAERVHGSKYPAPAALKLAVRASWRDNYCGLPAYPPQSVLNWRIIVKISGMRYSQRDKRPRGKFGLKWVGRYARRYGIRKALKLTFLVGTPSRVCVARGSMVNHMLRQEIIYEPASTREQLPSENSWRFPPRRAEFQKQS